jgi:hypothetical protein
MSINENAMSAIPAVPPRNESPVIRRATFLTWNNLWMFLMLILGILMGASATILWIDRIHHGMPHHPEEMVDRILSMIQRDAGMTNEEAKALRPIVEQHHRDLEEMHRRTSELFDSFSQDISAVLTPEQRSRWERRFKLLRHPLPPP